MRRSPPPNLRFSRSRFAVATFFTALTVSAFAQQGTPPENRPAESLPPEERASSALSEFTEEERLRVRTVLSQVWADPEVNAARDAVHEATENYRAALQAAVERIDPSAVDLINRMHQSSQSRAIRGRFRHRPNRDESRPGPPSPPKIIRMILEQEPAYSRLDSEEERARFHETAREVAQSGELDDAFRALRSATFPSREHARARREARDALVEGLSKRDPWLKEQFDTAPPRELPRPLRARPGDPPP